MGHTAHMPTTGRVLQRSVLEEGAARDLMKFSRNECKVLPWGRRRTPGVPLGWTDGGAALQKSSWVLANSSLNVSNEGPQHPRLC